MTFFQRMRGVAVWRNSSQRSVSWIEDHASLPLQYFMQSKLSWMRLPLSRNPIVIFMRRDSIGREHTVKRYRSTFRQLERSPRRHAGGPMSTPRSAGYLRVALVGLEANK
jgi:hypothetical protein